MRAAGDGRLEVATTRLSSTPAAGGYHAHAYVSNAINLKLCPDKSASGNLSEENRAESSTKSGAQSHFRILSNVSNDASETHTMYPEAA